MSSVPDRVHRAGGDAMPDVATLEQWMQDTEGEVDDGLAFDPVIPLGTESNRRT